MSRERRDNRETGEVEGRRLKVGVQSSEHFSLQTISCVSLFPLVAHLSAVCELFPGDLIFTGTPEGIGNRLDPPRFLLPGETLVSRAEGIGEITQRFST